MNVAQFISGLLLIVLSAGLQFAQVARRPAQPGTDAEPSTGCAGPVLRQVSGLYHRRPATHRTLFGPSGRRVERAPGERDRATGPGRLHDEVGDRVVTVCQHTVSAEGCWRVVVRRARRSAQSGCALDL